MTILRVAIGAAIGSVAALAWFVGALRRDATRDVASASLWPRPDGSGRARSFGEVWDIPSDRTRS